MAPYLEPLSPAHFEQNPPPVSEVDIQLEAVASSFEVTRAINAYIPMLNACYALAHETAFAIPDGYRVLAEVRTSAEEFPELVESPEVAAAISPDLEATRAAVSDPSAFGFVVVEEATGAILVCIRGTQTPREWMANFTAVPNPFSLARDFGLVHLGFELMERSVRTSIERALQPIDKGTRVTVIGHSLGGAMATLAAVDLQHNMGRTNVDVCTFGGPRVGKFIFRHKFNRAIPKCHRVTNSGDVVPHVPINLTGWVHVGEEIEVQGAGDNPHSLSAYLDGLRKLGMVREMAVPGVPEEEAVMARVLAVRVP